MRDSDLDPARARDQGRSGDRDDVQGPASPTADTETRSRPRFWASRRALLGTATALGLILAATGVGVIRAGGLPFAAGSADQAGQPVNPAPSPTFVPAPKGTVPPSQDEGDTPGTAAEVPPGGILEEAPGPESPRTLPAAPPLEITSDVPEQDSARGRVIDGMPAVVVIPDDAEVSSSSVARDGRRIQVAVDGSSEDSPEDVLEFYRRHFTDLGFLESPSPASAGATATAFTRESNGLVVTVRGGDGGTSFSVVGTLTATD